jgi:hypothetical protein
MPGEWGEKHKRDKDKERNASAMVSATYIYTPPGAPPTNDKRKKKGGRRRTKGPASARGRGWLAGCTRVLFLYFLFSLVLNIAEKREKARKAESRRESKLILLGVAGG